MAVHNLFIDTDRSKCVRSASDTSIAELPKFVQEDTLKLRVTLLAGFSVTEPYTKIPVEGITLQVALGVKIGNATTYYTQQFVWTPSSDLADPYWEASLPMNTLAIATLLGSAAIKQAFFEVKMIEDGTPQTVLSEQVNIHAAVIKDGGMSAPAEPTPLSVEVANVTYLQREIVGDVYLKHPTSGTIFKLYVGDDDTFHADRIA